MKSGARRAARLTVAACWAAGAAARPRAAVAPGSWVAGGGRLADWSDAAVGSEEENYLRVLQVAGVARARPWSVRPFGPGELASLLPDSAAHPWRDRAARDPSRTAFRLTGALGGATYNSDFPLSINDGAVWAGRGVTAYAGAGAVARWRWLSARIEPVAFWAQNQRTAIVANGAAGPQRFGDAQYPLNIDRPQRFGDRAYARIDPGQSGVRLDVLGLAAGVTAASQWWGPAVVDPLILGNNARGYPRLFVGTSRPVSVGIGTLHTVVQSGRLGQSAYAASPRDSAFRTGVGVAAVVTVRGVPGLELGGSRFFHEAWRGAGRAPGRLSAAFGSFYGYGGGGTVDQNEIGSVFGRWVFGRAGAEVYGEYMRNDASLNTRDLVLEPDHNSGYMVGFRRAWARHPGRLAAVRFEATSTRVTHLQRVRGQSPAYVHTQFRQGHTELGQVLGSEAAQGGGSTTVGYDEYRRDGRWTFEVARRLVLGPASEGAAERGWDVRYVGRVERLRFGRALDLFVGAGPVVQLNRNFGRDAYGVRLDAGWRAGGRRTR
jgi:hypothetical protein